MWKIQAVSSGDDHDARLGSQGEKHFSKWIFTFLSSLVVVGRISPELDSRKPRPVVQFFLLFFFSSSFDKIYLLFFWDASLLSCSCAHMGHADAAMLPRRTHHHRRETWEFPWVVFFRARGEREERKARRKICFLLIASTTDNNSGTRGDDE